MRTRKFRVKHFKRLFGEKGELCPSNIGQGRTVCRLLREFLELDHEELFDYFERWNMEAPKPLDTALALLQISLWEGAWALTNLFYDQYQKKESVTGQRIHKGDPACGLAIVGRDLGSPALARHYARLSSAGDVYWEHKDQDLKYGGYGPTMLEQYESADLHDAWRQNVRKWLKRFDQEPMYLEPFLAARWFSPARVDHVFDHAKISDKGAKPYVEVLLHAVESEKRCSDTTRRGTWFEAAAGLLLSTTPGFEVRSSRKTSDEQTDLVVQYNPDRLSILPLPPGDGLVECKSSGERITSRDLREFGAKCHFHRVKFGILVARSGITGKQARQSGEVAYAELVRRRAQVDGLTLLVLDISQLRGKARELRGLQDVLAADYDHLVFGPMESQATSEKPGKATRSGAPEKNRPNRKSAKGTPS